MKDSLRILNVEDNPNDAELNKAMISARWPRCELVRVANRKDYLEALEQGNFDLILSDFSMPGFDGWQALTLAREKRPQVPFLFVSGTIGEDTAIEALKNGATDYVLKHRPIRLIPAVDRALRDVEQRNECDRAEVAMRQAEHKYRELFNCLSDAAFLVDHQSGKIIDTNRRAEEMLNCRREEIIGRQQGRFLEVEQQPPRETTGRTGPMPQSATVKCELVRADSTRIPASGYATPLTLYGHALVLWLCRL